MFVRQNWFRFVASIFALTVVSAFAIAAIGPKYYPSLFTVSAESNMGTSVQAAEPMTIGVCDTAGPIEVESTGGTTTPTAYATLKVAFDAINAGTHIGSINIEVCGDTTETAMASLDASGVGATSYTDVTVLPVGGARTIEGSLSGTSTGAIVKLNGSDNVTIDGRQGGTGTARDLTIRNNSNGAGAAAVWLSSTAVDAGATNNVIRNLEVACGISNANANTTVGIIMSGTLISLTSNGADNDNNQFLFNRITSARYGIVTRGVTTNNNIAPIITDNVIGSNAFGSNGISKTGILLQADTGGIVSGNTIQYIGGDLANTTAGADRVGIGVGTDAWSATSSTTITSGEYTITKNVIRDVVEERTFSSAGIILGTTRGGSATNNLVANNTIYNLRANGTSGDQVVGIGVSGGNTDRIVFNSISLTGDMDPGAATASTTYGNAIRIPGANGTNNANFTVANNSIYLDASSSSTATNRYYAITLNGAAYSFGTGFLNNNNYYGNPANPQLQTGGLGTNTGNSITTQFALLADWQAALTTPQDANSIQADPLYFSNTSDLHIQQASPNVNAAATIAGITDDIDGQARPNGSNPDIGSDEFYPSPGSVQFNSASYSVSETAGTVTVTVTRSGGANGAASVDYATGGGTATGGLSCGAGVDYVSTLGTLNWADLDVAPKTFDIPICADGVLEAVETINVALANATTATLGTPSAAVVSINDAGSVFNGPINVGTGEILTSLTNPGGIFDAINNSTVTGNVIINITSDLTGENGAVALNEISGGFTVTIKPSGAPRSITGAGASGILRFNGADGITIDGSLSGGTDRSLTITSSSAGATGGGIYFASGVSGAQNNTVKNLNVFGNGSTTGLLLGITFAGNTFGGVGADNDNNRIENCDVRGAFYGIASLGASAANKDTGVVITNNVMPSTGTAGIGRVGIYVIFADGAQITQNSIASVFNPGSVDTIGIAAGSQALSSTPLGTGGISNALIAGNYVGVVSNIATFSAAGIVVASDTTGTNNVINNMVTGVTGNSNSGDIVAGIYINGLAGSTQNVYHNSVSMTGDRLPVTANMFPSYALVVSTDQPVNVVNNALFNSQTRTGSTGGGGESYAIGFDGPAANVNLLSNYNDLFVSGPIGVVGITGDLTSTTQGGTAGTGTNQATLVDWQTATSEDVNSLSVDPLFVSSTDLHLQAGSPAINAGTAVGVLSDFDGQARDATPDIGADEFVVATMPGILDIASPTYTVGEAGPVVTITVNRSSGSDGAVTVDYTLADGTASGGATCGVGVDFVNTGGTVSFANGETSKTFDVAICDDSEVESDETFTATISNATGGATIGTQASTTVTITDNDVPAGPVTVAASAGTPAGIYNTLTEAVTAVNDGTHQGSIVINVNQTIAEPGTVVINGSGAGAASYTSLLIRPTANGIGVSGASAQGRGLIELNGADNVIIDGDNPNTAGINRDLTIQNTAANTINFTSVVRIAMNITTVNTADNNIFRNLNVVGSATGANISTATASTGPQNTTFGIFSGPNATGDVTAPNPITSVITGVAAGATASNLIVSNNSFATVGRAVSINGSATSVHTGLQIRDNFIGNPVAADVNQVTAIGITVNGATSPVIADNTVYVEGFIRASAATHGINVGVNSTNTTGAIIERNLVNRVRNNDLQSWSAYGINIAGIAASAHTVRNNFVSGVINDQTGGTGAFGTTFGAYGIRIVSGTNHQVYHNSVNLYGVMGGTTSTNLTAAFMIVGTTQTGLDVRNNVFVNTISGGNPATPGTRNVAIYVPTGATSAMNLTLNNNNYFVGADALNRMAQRGTTFGTGEYTLADFDPSDTANPLNFRNYSSTLTAAGTNDDASRKVDPDFVSNVDLHILATSQMESGGVDVGVVDDIDGDVRPSVPDIGADEITVAGPGSLQFSSTNYGTNEGTTATINVVRSAGLDGTVGVTATITDGTAAGGAACTAGVDYINPGPQVLSFGDGIGSQSFNLVTCSDATLKVDETVILTLSSPTGGATIGANNPSTLTIIDVPPPFSGTINVGTGELFTSLTNPGGIFEAINEAGLSGNLTIDITSDLMVETGVVSLNQFTETGAGGYTLTFKPSGAPRTISGTAAVNIGLINLNGVDRVTFDGSLSGGTDRSLTISNGQTGTSTVIWLRSASVGNGANDNTIRNTIINGATVGTAQTTAGILAGSGTTIGGAAEAPNSNNTVTNNHIYRVQNSIYNQGNIGFDQNWTITDNEFGSTVEADKNRFRGMLMGNAQNFVISGNTVNGVASTATTTAAMSGIQLAFTLNGGSIINNTITDIKNVSPSGTGAFGMQLSSATSTANVLISNNFISDVTALGSATLVSNGHGINFNGAGAGGYRVYYNSVNMNTNQGSGTTSALIVGTGVTAAGALDVRNNILANTQTGGATRFAIHSSAPASVFSAINFNDYFSTGSVGFLGGDRPALGDWQTATGQDGDSLAVDPLFVSATDLHLQAGSPVINEATPIAEVTTDIDGDARSATTPDIGADEFAAPANPGSLQFSNATYSGDEGSSPFTVTVTRTGGSTGSVTVDYATSNGTATGGAACTAGIDYINTNGTLTFADGVTSQTFNVVICDDADVEGDETINYTLSNPTGGATLGTPSTAVQTIVDNDGGSTTYSVSIGNARVTEGNAGTVNAVFDVTLTSNAPPIVGGGPVATVQYATANGTATAGSDYDATSGTLNFNAPGTLTVTVVVNGDTDKESNEFFFVNLSNPSPNTTIVDGQGAGIIVDEDRPYLADFDGDRQTDASVFRPSTGIWYARSSIDASLISGSVGTGNGIAVPGDYDGDGITDFALWQPSTGNWLIQRSSDAGLQFFNWGTAGDLPVQGDYDGDGKTDYAVYRPSTGTWWIVRSSDSSAYAQAFGISTDIPVQGDFDGDFKTDLAVYRGGTWYVLQSSTSTVTIQNWGLSTDTPIAGDFDGDGRNDLAVYRDGVWWILNSLSGETTIAPFGTSTDVPVAGDYDGDGSSDIAIFRPSTGEWFLVYSSGGSAGLLWGIATDVAVPSAYTP